jgi:phosphoribosylaminoimidazolecarboxamide formyltransferase / IMP cyclohydrolase
VGLTALVQHHGKDLSYNNFLDLDGALLSLSPFAFSARPAVCIVKHTTPCGLAVGDTLVEAYEKALRCDPMSAFGSVVAVNRPIDADAAERMAELFIECLIAPAYSDEAMALLTKKKNIRIMTYPGVAEPVAFEPASGWWPGAPDDVKRAARFLARHNRAPTPRVFRGVSGGVLAQTPSLPPFYGVDATAWKTVTKRAPTEAEMDDLRFAWAAVFGVKSNAILLAGGGATLGIGAGQMSRVDASKIAVMKAGDAKIDLAGSVLASDAFFPFRDGVDAAAEAGVKAIVEPGGSVRDQEVIDAADEHGIAMVFTGRRLFRH